MYNFIFKRLIDIIISLCGLIILTPVIAVIFISIKVQQQGKVLYFQNRPGKNGKIFKIIKFKTMSDEKDKDGNLLSDEKRISKVGKLIRSLSLDEIPQLINIIKGDMSIVGPRPLMPKYLPLYNKQQMRRHEVKPGITGWAQINGRNDISWGKKFELDVWYVDNISFLLDLKIIFLTIVKVIKKEGVSKSGYATTTPFDGTN